MKRTTTSRSSSPARLGVLAVLSAALIASCGGGSPAPLQAVNVGTLTAHPDTSIGSQYFIGQAHFGGDASNLGVKGLHWGRLVNVVDKGTQVVLRDFVISGAIRDGSTFSPSVGPLITFGLTRNPVTDQFTLRIGAPQNTGQEADEVTAGTQRFREALAFLESNLTPVFDRGVEPDEVGPFSMVPRNAAMVMRFDDLLEPVFDNGVWNDQNNGNVANPNTGQLHKSLLRIRTGYPPIQPFEARLILDPNHGNIIDRDGDGIPEFYSTRVIISSTVSATDSQQSDPPLAINSTGLPESLVADDSNVALRVPTLVAAGLGQSQVLRNASGRAISFLGNGSTDNATGTLDIVRALRSGGGLIGDPNNGFLLDEDPPSLLGDMTVTIGSPADYAGCDDCTELDLVFDVTVCESVKVDDLLTQSTPGGLVTGIVRGWDSAGTLVTQASQVGNTLVDIVVETITAPDGYAFSVGGARLGTRYEDGDNAACFVRFSPPPLTPPNVGLSPHATAFLLFSEPMDPGTVKAFDQFTITRTPTGPPIDEGYQYAVGRVAATANLRNFSWQHPNLPLSHVNGTAESYTLTVAPGLDGPRDLAGNPLAVDFEPFVFLLDEDAETDEVGGFAMRFQEPADSLFDDGLAEIRDSQMIFDPENERLLPRPVTRFTATADATQTLPGLMTTVTGGVQTPLSNLGSKLQTLWRVSDLGFTITDETNYNVDVEGLSWAPVGGNVSADVYGQFQVALTHSYWVPDELIDPSTNLPVYPASGLTVTFANNPNDIANDPLTVVHPKSSGYVVSSGDLYNAETGTPMLPFPLNQGLTPENYQFYTWRDTALLALGGGTEGIAAQGNGVPPDLLGLPKDFNLGLVPTVGLPLLMEFRCYQSNEALGLNAFDVAFTQSLSPQPNFRVFSTGGYVGTEANPVDPDNMDTALGGYNPLSTPPGASTPPADSTFYFGELALVTRVSRAHSVWFDTGTGYTRFAQPFLEPEANQQPSGTAVQLAFRGGISAPANNILAGTPTGNAQNLDAYGDGAGNPTFLEDNTWRTNISEIDTARWFQFRLTFISNAATERTAELRTLAFAYYKTDPGQ